MVCLFHLTTFLGVISMPMWKDPLHPIVALVSGNIV